MRSGTSFFNKAFSKSLLRRFWPLWALWLVLLLTIGVGDPLGYAPESYPSRALYAGELNHVILEVGVALVYCSMAAGPLVAMAMLGYLYSPRACGMVSALPMRREETYFTAVLTGIVPMLAADVLAYLVLLALFGRVEGINPANIHLWLGLVVLGNVAFYGFACFCGVLTGNTVVLPLVYVALGFAAWVVENTVRELLSVLVYGYTWQGIAFGWLSPIPCTLNTVQVFRYAAANGAPDEALTWYVGGVPYLAGLCAAGIALAVLAVLILKRRHMETAGDIVAVPVLRPIFRVCMAVGTGLVLATFGSDAFFGNRPTALAVILMLVLGAALGYFMAEALIKKTLRVFKHGWGQLGLICLCLALPFALAKLDVTGYETRIPDPEQVAQVSLGYSTANKLTERDSILAAEEFHRRLIEHKAENEKARRRVYTMIPLAYTLRDGTTVERRYRVPNDARAWDDPDSDIAAYERVLNLPELILRRTGAKRGLTAEEVKQATVEMRSPRGDGVMNSTLPLTPEQALSLFEEGVWLDAKEGTIARWFMFARDESRAEVSNVDLTLELRGAEDLPFRVTAQSGAVHMYKDDEYYNFNVSLTAEHTLRWLEENLGITPVPETEVGVG